MFANLLGKAGISTLLVERNAGLSGQPKALMVDDEFFRLLHKIGLGDAFRAHGVGPISYDYVSILGFTVVQNRGRLTENGFASRTAMFQPDFEKILMEGVKRFPSVEVQFNAEVVGLEQDSEKVGFRLRSGQEDEPVTADYLVAADGSHSPCRKALGIEFDELVEVAQRHIVVDVLGDSNRTLTARICARLERVYTSLPSPNGGRRYEFSLRRDEVAEDMLTDATLSRLVGWFTPYEKLNVVRKAVYSFQSRLARTLRMNRVFLAGDAAHVMPIFGSQGMNSGVRDAHNLTWKLARVLDGRASPSLLDSYHDERHSQVAETIRVASANMKLQSSRALPVSILRDLVLKASTFIPSIRRYFAEMRYIPKPFLQKGVVVNPPARRDGSIVGRLLPAPEVRAADKTGLLDDVIGPGWALVGVNIPRAEKRPASPLWDDLEVSWTTIAAAGGDADATLLDGRFDEILAVHSGEWLLVRPDRIVAAAGRADELPHLVGKLAAILTLGRSDAGAFQQKELTHA